MKKILLILSAACCLTTLAACGGHTHKMASSQIKYDDEYHWFSCTEVGCEEQLNKEEHKWNDGKVNEDKTKVTYSCKFCSAKREELYNSQLAPTVTETEWKNAFLASNFKNVTAKIEESIAHDDVKYKSEYLIEANKDVIYVVRKVQNSYSATYQEGTLQWSFTSPEQTKDEATVANVSLSEVMSSDNLLNDYGLDLSHLYGSFTYDPEGKCYVATDVTSVNLRYSTVTVKLENGRIIEIFAKGADAGVLDVKISLGKYGTTVPQPPQ